MAPAEQQPDSQLITEQISQQQTVQVPPESTPAQDATIAGVPHEVSPPVSDVLPELPGYSVEAVLGRGGMGVVYQAVQRLLNRPVALKMIVSGEHAGPEDRLRFLTEAESIARVQHPGIVQLYEFGTHQGFPYFALELVSGGTLERKLSGTPLPAREAAILIEKLARSMQAAHDAGVVHRDLKPANVLLTAAGEPKITDFGLAKTGGSNLTVTGAILGTPSYMAPEQADGRKDVGTPTDVYALGAIMYECLTGRPPFKAASHLETIKQVVANEPVSVRFLQESTPRDLETICHKCLAKEPEKRYPTMAALAEDLRRFQNHEPIDARPVGRVEKAWRWCRRNPVVAGLTAAMVVMLSGVAATSLAMSLYVQSKNVALDSALQKSQDNENDARKAAQEAQREKDRSNTMLARQYAANASKMIEQGDCGGALLWTSEALEVTPPGTPEEVMLRKQFNQLQRRHPRPVGSWAFSKHFSVGYGGDLTNKRFLSADGSVVLIPQNKSVVIQDLRNGRQLPSPKFPEDMSLHQAMLTSDGKVGLALLRLDWSLGNSLEDLFILMQSPGSIGQMITSAVGVMTLSFRLVAWNTQTGKVLYSQMFVDTSWQRLTVSEDDQRFCVGACIGEVATGKVISSIPLPEMRFHRLIMNASGTKVIVESWQQWTSMSARVWDVAAGQWMGPLLPISGEVRDAGFTEDDQPLALTMQKRGSENTRQEYLEAINIATGKQAGGPFEGSADRDSNMYLLGANFNQKRSHVIAYTHPRAMVWELTSGKEVISVGNDLEVIRTVEFDPSFRFLVSKTQQSVLELLSLEEGNLGTLLCPRWQHHSDITWLRFADQRHLLLAAQDGSLTIREFTTTSSKNAKGVRNDLKARWLLPGNIEYAEISKDGRFVVVLNSGGNRNDMTMSLWDLAEVATEQTHLIPSESAYEFVYQANFVDHGQAALLLTFEGEAQVVNLKNTTARSPKLTFKDIVNEIPYTRHVVVSPNQKQALLIQGWDSEIRGRFDGSSKISLAQVETGQTNAVLLEKDKSCVRDACFSPDGRRCIALLVYSKNQATLVTDIHVWDTQTGKQLAKYESLEGERGHVRVFFSDDSREATVLPAEGGTVIRIDTLQGTLTREGGGFSQLLNYDPKLRVFATGMPYLRMESLELWDLSNLKSPLWKTRLTSSIAEFCPTTRRVATTHGQVLSSLRLCDVTSGLPVVPMMPHDGEIKLVRFFDRGRILASFTEIDRQLTGGMTYSLMHLWDVERGARIGMPTLVDGGIRDVYSDDNTDDFSILTDRGRYYRFDVQPTKLSIKDTVQLTLALTGRTVDKGGNLTTIPTDKHKLIVFASRLSTPAAWIASKQMLIDWHTNQLRQANDSQAKVAHLSSLIDLNAESIDYRKQRATLLQEAESFDKAVEDYAWLIQHEPKNQAHWIARGMLQADKLFSSTREKNHAAALQHAERGLTDLLHAATLGPLPNESLNDLSNLCWFILLDAKAGQKHWHSAWKVMEAICSADMGYREHCVMALALLRMGKLEDSLKAIVGSMAGRTCDEPSYRTQCLLCLGNTIATPLVIIWGSYHPCDLLVHAWVQKKLGRNNEARQTYQLLRMVMLRPENGGVDTAELEALLGK